LVTLEYSLVSKRGQLLAATAKSAPPDALPAAIAKSLILF